MTFETLASWYSIVLQDCGDPLPSAPRLVMGQNLSEKVFKDRH